MKTAIFFYYMFTTVQFGFTQDQMTGLYGDPASEAENKT